MCYLLSQDTESTEKDKYISPQMKKMDTDKKTVDS